MNYKCPVTKENGYDIEHCESSLFGGGCAKKDICTVYQINKNGKTVRPREKKAADKP